MHESLKYRYWLKDQFLSGEFGLNELLEQDVFRTHADRSNDWLDINEYGLWSMLLAHLDEYSMAQVEEFLEQLLKAFLRLEEGVVLELIYHHAQRIHGHGLTNYFLQKLLVMSDGEPRALYWGLRFVWCIKVAGREGVEQALLDYWWSRYGDKQKLLAIVSQQQLSGERLGNQSRISPLEWLGRQWELLALVASHRDKHLSSSELPANTTWRKRFDDWLVDVCLKFNAPSEAELRQWLTYALCVGNFANSPPGSDMLSWDRGRFGQRMLDFWRKHREGLKAWGNQEKEFSPIFSGRNSSTGSINSGVEQFPALFEFFDSWLEEADRSSTGQALLAESIDE